MRIDNIVASFPTLFTATKVKGSDRSRYGLQILMPPDHPQLGEVWDEFQNVMNAGFPSGLGRNATVCMGLYEDQVDTNKDYYDPRFNGWYQISAYSPGDKPRPTVVAETGNGDLEVVMDPAKPFSGELMHVHINFYCFKEGNTGVAAGLNGVCLTGEEGPMGRLDNRPTAEQMFGKPVNNPGPSRTAPQQQRPGPVGPGSATARPGTPAAPVRPGARPAPPVPPKANVKQMTQASIDAGYTYEFLKENGFTDVDMIEGGWLVGPAVTPSFR